MFERSNYKGLKESFSLFLSFTQLFDENFVIIADARSINFELVIKLADDSMYVSMSIYYSVTC